MHPHAVYTPSVVGVHISIRKLVLFISPNQSFRDFHPLLIHIKQLGHLSPFIPDALCLVRVSWADIRLERIWQGHHTVDEIFHIRDNLVLGSGVYGALEVKCPEHARQGEEDGPVGNVHALAPTPPGAEDEMVTLSGIGVIGGIDGCLVVIDVAERVETARVGMPVGVHVHSPVPRQNSLDLVAGLFIELAYQTLRMTVASLGMR